MYEKERQTDRQSQSCQTTRETETDNQRDRDRKPERQRQTLSENRQNFYLEHHHPDLVMITIATVDGAYVAFGSLGRKRFKPKLWRLHS